MASLRVTSYNCTGLGHDKRMYIDKIATDCDILLIQEHWLHKANLDELNELHSDFSGTGVSGMPEKKLHTVGRPFGGSAILYRKSLSHHIKHKETNAKNVTAIMLKDMLIVSVYLPGDNYHASNVSAELISVIDQLDTFIGLQEHKSILVGGDLNMCLNRDNSHARYLKSFAQRHNLHFIETHDLATYDVTYQQRLNDGGVRVPTCDNYLVCEDIYNNVQSIECPQSIDNSSYHFPLMIQFAYDIDRKLAEPGAYKRSKPSIAWNRVNNDHTRMYQTILRNKLSFRTLPECMHCTDVFCDSEVHHAEIDNYCELLVKSCLDAADSCCPKNVCKSGKAKCTPYWNEEVSEKRRLALDAKWLWEETGKPNSGSLYDDMRSTKRRYHYAIRSIKRGDTNLRNARMAEALASGRQRDMWSETRRVNKNKPSNIDGLYNDDDIADHFAGKNRTLYNSVPSDPEKIKQLCSILRSRINHDDNLVHKCNVPDIKRSIDRVKYGKSDGDEGLMSDHVKHAPDLMAVQLSLLFNTVIRHGYVPKIMLRGSITHIPKDPNGMLCDSCNYRGICLCIVFTKIFEDILMYLYGHLFDTSGLQFAYKKKLSTNVATLTLKEVLRYYRLRSTRVFGCALDASKAFDRIRHDKLFDVLLHRGLPPIILRVMIDMYTRQISRCVYFSAQSEYYSISNGTRQGGVASPILFIVYMDILYDRLKDAGFGLHIGLMYYGVLGYADDLMLLASSVYTLQKMVTICEDFGREYDVLYNPTKSKVIVFDSNKSCVFKGNNNNGLTVVLNGCDITEVKELLYLGNIIRSDMADVSDIRQKISDLNARTNSLCHKFGSASYSVKCVLFYSKCVHAYGAETWDLSANECLAYWAACRQAMRRVMGLPPSCPSAIVESISGIPSGHSVVIKKAQNIINCFAMSDNVFVANIYKQSMYDHRSIIRRNLDVIVKHNDINHVLTPECQAVRELLDVRDGNLSILDLSPEEIDAFVMMFSMR